MSALWRRLAFSLVLFSIAAFSQGATPPIITSLSPNPMDAGGAFFQLIINGSGFVDGASVNWLPKTPASTPLGKMRFLSSTQLSAEIITQLRTIEGAYTLTVINPDGGVSNSYKLTVSPVILTITPSAALAGSPSAVTITAKGIGFTQKIQLVLNASGQRTALPTTLVDTTTLRAVIPATALSAAGSASIEAVDPIDNIASATSVQFDIRTTPAIATTSLTAFDAGGAGFYLTVNGTGFTPTSVVNWSGAALSTAFVSSAELHAVITSELRSLSGTFNLTVSGPIGGTSNPYAVTVSPVLFAISPAVGVAAALPVTITATGIGFTPNNVLTLTAGGQISQLPTTYVKSTTLTAIVPAAALHIAGAASVQVVDSGGPGHSLIQTFTIFEPTPTITGISPAAATAGAPAFTLTVNGANFVAGGRVLWNGSPLATAFVSTAMLVANVPANLITDVPSAVVSVSNPGGAVSGSLIFSVDPAHPTIGGFSPASATAGAASFTLTVTGSGFAVNCVLRWNGTPLPTTFVNATQVTATVPDGAIAGGGAVMIALINPSGLTSNAATFAVNTPVPAISNLTPASAPAGGPAFTLTIDGANFLRTSTVLWNGAPLATALESGAQLTATVPANLPATGGTASVRVSTPGAADSNVAAFTIGPAALTVPPPAATSAGIVNAASGLPSIAPGSLISIYGTNLGPGNATAAGVPLPGSLNGTAVTVNGSPAPLFFVSPLQINAQVPFETKAGTATLVVQSGLLKSPAVNFQIIETAPGVLTVPQSNHDMIQHAIAQNDPEGTLNSPDSPAHPGQYVTVYLTGQGQVDNPVATGAAALGTPFSVPLAPIQVQVGGSPAVIAFAGLAPGFVGLLQMNIVIPEVPSGEQPFDVTIGGVLANRTVLSVSGDR